VAEWVSAEVQSLRERYAGKTVHLAALQALLEAKMQERREKAATRVRDAFLAAISSEWMGAF